MFSVTVTQNKQCFDLNIFVIPEIVLYENDLKFRRTIREHKGLIDTHKMMWSEQFSIWLRSYRVMEYKGLIENQDNFIIWLEPFSIGFLKFDKMKGSYVMFSPWSHAQAINHPNALVFCPSFV